MINKNELKETAISSINLAIEKPDAWFLSDDDNTKLYALQIGLNVMCSSKVIADAAVEGKIKSIKEMTEILHKLKKEADYPLTDEMIIDIIQVVENRIKENDEFSAKERESNLIDTVTKALKKMNESKKPKTPFELCGIDHYHGWYGLTLPIIEEIRLYNKRYPFKKIEIRQIKEKFGTLNIYVSRETPDYIQKMIFKAGRESRHVCEKCGAKGKTVRIRDWYWTLCEDHRKAKEDANNNETLEDKIYKNIINNKNFEWTEADEKESEELE